MKPIIRTLLGLAFLGVFSARAALAGAVSATPVKPDASALFDHQLKRLHASERVNLRQAFAGRPLLVVNTASFCGFTGQFQGLEALHREYSEKGLKVVGFPSDDFNQEAKDEAQSAEVCFINYGVSFDMFSPIHVRGDKAHPIFREIARQSGTPPRWNFYKYVIDREGRVVAAFSSMTAPDSLKLRKAIESVL